MTDGPGINESPLSPQFSRTLDRAAKTITALELTPQQIEGVLNVLRDSMAEVAHEILRHVREVETKRRDNR